MKSIIYKIPEVEKAYTADGNGNKGLLIVLHKKDLAENKATLDGLIKAIKYDSDDVTILSIGSNKVTINDFVTMEKYVSLFLIGVEPSAVGFTMNTQKYFTYTTENIELLLIDSLHDMNEDKSKKMKFWEILQKLFLQPA